MRRTRRTAAVLALVCGALLAAAGCGVGAGEGPADVRLVVTDGFGSRPVGEAQQGEVPGGETVMRMLQRNFDVSTRYGGGFVQSIEGLGGGTVADRPVDWFFYVNGIENPRGAAAQRLRPGDRVWWDRHDWGTAMRVPAVVGAFPEPFRSGIDGERLPVRLECERAGSPACEEAGRRLSAAGIAAGRSALGQVTQGETLRVLVGRWPALRRTPEAQRLEQGPARSGVFARMERAGSRVTVLDAQGRPTRTLGPGAGLVAATRNEDRGATWLITGTDDRGVLAAAGALEEGALGEKFALAIAPDGVAVPLPEVRRAGR